MQDEKNTHRTTDPVTNVRSEEYLSTEASASKLIPGTSDRSMGNHCTQCFIFVHNYFVITMQ